MRRKMLNVPKGSYDGMKGFTIIEFLVAGMLSMIVLMAVGSSYFTSRKLNDAANERLAIQQDLRNAATLIVRDARMAGSFGCFNMSEHTEKNVVSDVPQKNRLFSLKGSSANKLIPNGTDNKLIPITESLDINYQNFFQVGSALIFQYGIDDVNASAATTVVSSCAAISKPGKQILTLENVKKELKISDQDKEQNGNIARQRHVVNAYAVGRIAGEEGLFRFQLDDKGKWGNPQLLAKKIRYMKVRYIYVSDCPEDDDAGKEETFRYTDKFNSAQDAVTPAGVEVLLSSGTDTKIAASSDNHIYAYRIDATIRGGNVCANRTL
ncbi:prepilin-type N-terminal cleavage/methylation domain-containing protein [Neisseria meningitidis]|uniref:PilW family protein n=1 Tax=Neisseria meningitidis TaxID=487 RepID=UPI0007665B65|nr:PilW family protein [Neisseria meningitidis]CWM57696.1 prepilin-type N-terminal cleavage/methylation domain-containing protein [Neisseria meningitidis]CWN26988.1 prepilin-type N-terminal cleavage/methylation domain-containing protein [Neisseria meningitidis]CWQ37894.1 prepilin-type N-terminal cleavage/methylation domain-containing protein [Neisseria meningitidis]CWR20770.1 prepilin-type N-terminal cleavage/methylation domain-containing protein [Neisseria meningitidis]